MSWKARHTGSELSARELTDSAGPYASIVVPIIVHAQSSGRRDARWQFATFLATLLVALATYLGPVVAARVARPAATPPFVAESRTAVDPRLVVSESTTRALDSRDDATREGALIRMGMVARLSPDPAMRWQSVMELTAYVRRHSPRLPHDESTYCRKIDISGYPSDVQLALDQLGSRHLEDRHKRVDLRGVNLAYANLSARDLRSFGFDNALLCRADLSNAMLQGTSFRGANLSRAWMAGAIATNRQLLEAASLRGMVLPVLWPRTDSAVSRRVEQDPEISQRFV